MDLANLTIEKAHQGLLKKDFSARELAESYFQKIENEDKKIHSYLTLCRDSAILQAKETDEMIARGKNISLMAGIPSAIKDNLMVERVRCTAGSKILGNYVAPYDATAIKKLKDQGTVILGKTNLDEFAMGSSTENSSFGPTRNPSDFERVPGGSSGGSAAAVAADLCLFALGSDTGGSIRQPASFCGTVGLKPTYGAVSRYGLIAFASSLDQIGPITKTVQDCQTVFKAISGRDEMDATSVDCPTIENLKFKIGNLKIGIPKEYFIKGLDGEVEKIIKAAIKKYQDLGAKIVELSLPYSQYALPCYYIIAPSEASANLARYDGIKYGYSTTKREQKTANSLLDVYLQSRGEGFGAEVRRRIMLGTYALSAGYYDAYYLRAQKVRTLICRDFEKAFEKVDAIFSPTSPTPAFKIGEKTSDPLKMYLSDIYTVSVNLAGLPAISIPVGKTAASPGLPVGLQIIGKPFEEQKIMEIAKIYVG